MASSDLPSSVKFYYLKSPLFRVVHSDGAVGGITPRGLIHCAFYSERPAIPQVQTHNISPEGQLLEPSSSEGKDGIVREMDVDVIMTRSAAADLRDWLNGLLNDLDALEKMQGTKP